MSNIDYNAELLELLRQINSKLEKLLHIFENPHSKPLAPQADIMTLLNIPDPLRKTALALLKIGEATASDIAQETCRFRNYECEMANELVRLGLAKKRRRNRRVYFNIEPEGIENIEK